MTEERSIPVTLLFSGLPKTVFLLVLEGRLIDASYSNISKVRGNACLKQENTFALYADEGHLVFQANTRRWNFSDIRSKIRYGHDYDEKVTNFSIDDFQFNYPSWWKDDPSFDPVFPEFDEDEDYLGYIYGISQRPEFLLKLLEAWRD